MGFLSRTSCWKQVLALSIVPVDLEVEPGAGCDGSAAPGLAVGRDHGLLARHVNALSRDLHVHYSRRLNRLDVEKWNVQKYNK